MRVLAELFECVESQTPYGGRAVSWNPLGSAWLALGLDTENAVFYRQSDIPEITELTWILTSMTAKRSNRC